MHSRTRQERQPASEWRSISLRQTAVGYTVREDASRFRKEVCAEIALRFTGIASILAAYFQWFAPALLLLTPPVWVQAVLSVIFAGTGLMLYLLSARGFRRELQADLGLRELRLVKLNARGAGLIRARIPMGAIDSLYLRRSDTENLASLMLRCAGGETCLMRGPEEELETLHRKLCRDITLAMQAENAASTVQPRRVVPRRTRRTGLRGAGLMPAGTVSA
jgi:hypothetical protein